MESFKADILSLALFHLLLQRANAQNISFKTLYGGQFMLPTQLIIPIYPIIWKRLFS